MLKWIATQFGDYAPTDPDLDGSLVDDGIAVGRVRFDRPTDPTFGCWSWAMQAGGRKALAITTSGRCQTKEEAKAATERAYARFCEDLEERAFNLKTVRASREAHEAWARRHGRG